MLSIVWEFWVRPGREAEFERRYAPADEALTETERCRGKFEAAG